MKAKTFLEHSIEECKRGKRTSEAIDFDEKLLSVAEFYSKPFSPDMLANPHGEKSPSKNEPAKWSEWNKAVRDVAEHNILFDGWWKNVVGEYQNPDTRYILHFQLNSNKISIYDRDKLDAKGDVKVETVKMPETLDDFIRDCQRTGIELTWKDNVIDNYFKDKYNHHEQSIR